MLGSHGSLIADRLFAQIEDLPWVVVRAEPEAGVGSKEVESCAHFLGKNRPSVVVVLIAGDETDALVLPQLKQYIPYCENEGVPIIQVSNYMALDGASPFAEHPDTSLVSKNSSEGESNLYADFERAVSRLPKHIILRRSWVLDGEGDALLSKFIPQVLNSANFTVSSSSYGCPITNSFLADAIVAIIQQVLTGAENWGLYHVQSADKCSEAEFCDQLLRSLGKELDKEFVTPQVAEHESVYTFLPGAANLSGRKLTDDFGIQLLSWRKGFTGTLRRWLFQKGESLSV